MIEAAKNIAENPDIGETERQERFDPIEARLSQNLPDGYQDNGASFGARINDLHNEENIDENTANKDPHKEKNIRSSDKQNVSSFDQWSKIIDKTDSYATWASLLANFFCAFMHLSKIPNEFKDKMESVVNFVTSASFVPLGLSGMKNGILKRDFTQAVGFALEGIVPWFGDLKNIYLLRGLSTGTDQLWAATEDKLKSEFSDGIFPDWITGFKRIPVMCWDLLKEVIKDPVGTILTKNSKGHHAFISTIGDYIASIGYMITGNEKVFGTIRDISAFGFDWGMLLSERLDQKMSGVLFCAESLLDFVARFFDNKYTRLFVNQLSHAAGRAALMLYKNSSIPEKFEAEDKSKMKIFTKDLSG